jgi:mycothiol synthase
MAMIEWEWCSRLDGETDVAVRSLLEAAEDYDREQGFSVVDYRALQNDLSDPDSPNRVMLVHYVPSEQAERELDDVQRRLAAVLRAEMSEDGAARVSYTVDPDLRSLGITTLLVEEIGLPGRDGSAWNASGISEVTTWARGNHPAADRLTSRFRIPATEEVWRLFRELKEDDRTLPAHEFVFRMPAGAGDSAAITAYEQRVEATPRPAVGLSQDIGRPDRRVVLAEDAGGTIVGAAAIDLRTTYDLIIGRWADITYVSTAPEADERLIMWLLDSAVKEARSLPIDTLILHVDPADEDLVHAVRLLGFVHERTDVAYRV